MLADDLARRLSARGPYRRTTRIALDDPVTTDDQEPPMTRTTLVHDPVAGDRVEVFLRVTGIWIIVDDALRHVQDLDELKEVRAVHECLDPLGMPDGPDGPVWSVPPEPMWRLVERRRGATGPGRWLTEAVNRVRAILLEEFTEFAATDHVDEALDDERATAAVVAQLGGTAVSVA